MDQLFQEADPESTGVTFVNRITTSDTLSVLDFEYIYNGGGTAVGDINNDGLQDLYFSGNMTSGKLYLNKGNLKFEDITTSAGLTTSSWCNGVTMVDINQDGFKDLYICAGGTRNTPARKMKNLLFINQGNNTFKEQASDYGLEGTGYTIQSTFLDYDKDGDLDVYLLRNAFVSYSRNRAKPKSIKGESSTTDQLYRNNGNLTFTDVSDEAGILIEGFGLGVQACDLNNDDWPDLYVSNDFITNDLVYINNGNGTFTNKATQYLKHQSYNAMGCDLADFNNDGLTDIMVVDMLPEDNKRWKLTITGNNYDEFENSLKFGYEPQYIRNTLQLNNGNNTFSDIAYLAGVEATDWSWSPLFADFDNDGLKDLFITNGYRQDITNLDFIKFSEQSSVMGTPDGNKKERLHKLSEIQGIKEHNYVYKNNGDLTFTNKSNAWGTSEPSYSNGSAIGDLDNDGDLDLVVNNIDAAPSLLINTDKNKESKASGNYLRIALKGSSQNLEGFGSKIYIHYNRQEQFQYFTPFRGFLSTSEAYVHFGLGNLQRIDTLEIFWPDGKYQLLKNINSNQVITLNYKDASALPLQEEANSKTIFNLTEETGIDFIHQENEFIDFKIQPLLPHMHSRNGPGVAVADVNGDGREDFFIGAASTHSGALYVQQVDGKFKKTPISTDTLCDDMGVLFFDADNDGDNDLYVVSGGTGFPKESALYQDHLYINDGKGKFNVEEDALPPLHQSGSTVIASDYDHDGDLDLFIGSRIIAGEYPMQATSYLLRNDSEHGSCRFKDVTATVAPELIKIGLVTAALWTDFNNDGWRDLAIVGEFMPITFYENMKGKSFSLHTNDALKNSNGWWNSLTAGDFDNDGDIDYVAGNLGLNSRYKTNPGEPLCIYASDFDKSGSIDPVISIYRNGQKQIVHSWDDMVKQMSPFRARFRTYEPYAETPFEKSFTPSELNAAYSVCSNTFSTSYIENTGNGKFSIKPLPMHAQFAPVFGMIAEDYDHDGNLDLLMTGNSYSTEASTGRYDAFVGLYLKGDGKGNFNYVTSNKSGFDVSGDSKGLARIILANNHELIICGINSGKPKTYVSDEALKFYRAPANASYALVTLKNKKTRKHEFYYGDTYLSQSSRSIHVTASLESVTVYNSDDQIIDSVKNK